MAYVFVFIEGIMAFISPCILPMFPVYVMYLAGKAGNDNGAGAGTGAGPGAVNGAGAGAGTGAGAGAGNGAGAVNGAGGKKKVVINTLGFILGFTVVFVSLGATASWIGGFVSNHKGLLQRVSGAIIILFGLFIAGFVKIPWLNRDIRFNVNISGFSFFSSALFGAAFSFGWSPCLGVFLGSAFMLAANNQTVFEGMFMLFLFSLGLGIPFLICTIFIDSLTTAFGFIKSHYRTITVVSGIVLIIAGVALLFDVFGYWTGLFDSLLPN